MKAYVILRADGQPKRRRHYASAFTAYTTQVMAQRFATSEGDSIVEVDVDMTKEPVFIRQKVLRG